MKMATSQAAKNIQAAQPTIKLLESMDPKALILRLKCSSCTNTFTHDAAFVLRMTRSTGFFIPSSQCRKCRAKERKPTEGKAKKANPKVTKKKVKKSKAIKPIKIEAEAPEDAQPKVVAKPKRKSQPAKESTQMTYRPFANLKLAEK